MPEVVIAKIMLWGAVRFAMALYAVAIAFAMVILFLKDRHKRNWMGAMALTFALLATSIVFYYYSNGKQMNRIKLLKTLYYYPDKNPYQGEDTNGTNQ